ncbi:TPA: terminase [Enterobacter kobei]
MAHGRKKIKCVTSDPRWHELVRKYRYQWGLAAVQLFNKTPTWQQDLILESVQETGSRTSVSSGHGTGKSDMASIMVMLFIILFANARVILVATKIGQVRNGIFKYMRQNWAECTKRHPWLTEYFILTDTAFYERTQKGSWEVVAKGFRLGNEEALAGEHAEHLFYIIDEASGVSDKAIGVIKGALTQEDNRLLLTSQPTRPSGHFYDSHHTLKRTPAYPEGYNAIVLNSEESPLVSLTFIREKLAEYGGRDSPEYMIKVLGRFPSMSNEFLLGLDECDRAARRPVKLKKGWGWVACCDVGNGRDSSVLSIFKVSGNRNKRRVVPHRIVEYPGTIDAVRFADVIVAECRAEVYPNISIVIDGDGIGHNTATLVERAGLQVQRIRWGKRMHSKQDKSRFINQRAYANIAARDALRSGRLRLDPQSKVVQQASKIPASLNELGQWVIMKKEVMRQKFNIKSPDVWDTYCFAFLANFVPANMDAYYDDDRADAMRRFLNNGEAA